MILKLWVDVLRWLLSSRPCSDALIVPNMNRCIPWLFNLICGPVAVTSPEHLLEMQNLYPTPDLLAQNLHCNNIARLPWAHYVREAGNDTHHHSFLESYELHQQIIRIWLFGLLINHHPGLALWMGPLGLHCCVERSLEAQVFFSPAHSPFGVCCWFHHGYFVLLKFLAFMHS